MTPTEIRLSLRRGGYAPLPLEGKAPNMMRGWQTKHDTNPDEIRLWEKLYNSAHNTGVLTRTAPALDIDILHLEAAEAVEGLAKERFEERGFILTRTGKPPKRAVLFRTDAPFSKIIANLTAPDGSDQKIEFLGDGQQVVVDGIHPDTGRPYSWHGGDPWTIARDDLPYISDVEARQLVDDAANLLVSEFGFTLKGGSNGQTHHDGDDSKHDRADWSKISADIIAGVALHDNTVRLAASCIGSGMSASHALRMLRALMLASTAPHDERWQTRFSDLSKIVRDAENKYGGQAQQGEHPADLKSTLRPYVARPFADIPRRQWLHAKHYIRMQVVMTVAPGGYGKTALVICNVLEMVTGRGLLGPNPISGPLRVLYWNAEDPDDEVERRIAAACIYYQIDPASLAGGLFLGSRIANGERLARFDRKSGEVVLNKPLLAAAAGFVAENKIDCVIFDPLVAFHSLPENDNTAMEKLVKAGFEQLATANNCCVELSQHTRKPNPQAELTADDSRGAGATGFAARSVRVLNRMNAADAELPKIEPEERRHYLRVNRDKTNLAPPGKATWVRLVSVDLPNGDNVQVATAWDYPQPFDNMSADDMRWARDQARANQNYRTDSRSPHWFGIPLAARLKLDPSNKGDRKRLIAIIKTWIANGVLAVDPRLDEKRRERDFIVPGAWNEADQEGQQ